MKLRKITSKKLKLRNPDQKLWKQVKSFSKGKTDNKIKAVDLIFQKNYSLPEKSISLINDLAKSNQPKKVRRRIAFCLTRFDNISYGMYSDLVSVLSKDSDPQIKKIIRRELVKAGFGLYALNFNTLSPSMKSLAQASTRIAATTSPLLKQLSNADKIIQATSFSSLGNLARINKVLSSTYTPSLQKLALASTAISSQMLPTVKAINEANKRLTLSLHPSLKRLADERRKSLSLLALTLPTRQLTGVTAISEQINKQISKGVLRNTRAYYLPEELRILKKPTRIPVDTKAKELASLLKKCIPGRQNWEKYQNICGKIISYCFPTQFLEPFSQSATSEGLHKRDYVYPFAENIGGFWKYVQTRFGMGLGVVIECKNYSNLLKENEVIISSKYLGPKKYAAFGLILTRKGLHRNGKKATIKKWEENSIIILCLNDNDLLKMLELKEKGDEPSKVIQKLLDGFLRGLE